MAGAPVKYDEKFIDEILIPAIDKITDYFSFDMLTDEQEVKDKASAIALYTGGVSAIYRDVRKQTGISYVTFYACIDKYPQLLNSIKGCLDVLLNATTFYFIQSGLKIPPQILTMIYLNTYNKKMSDRQEQPKMIDISQLIGLAKSMKSDETD
jgi:hypothetical protein